MFALVKFRKSFREFELCTQNIGTGFRNNALLPLCELTFNGLLMDF